MKKIILILFSMIFISCGAGYEYLTFQYEPTKVTKKEIRGKTYYQIDYYLSCNEHKKCTIKLTEKEYNDLTHNGKRDALSISNYFKRKVRIDYD